jgi:peptide/nickel transport system substrate-binding protein
MKLSARATTILAFPLAASLAVAMTVAPPTAEAQSGGKPVLTVGLSQIADTLNPALMPEGVSELTCLPYAALTHLNPNGTVSPGLATSWHYVGGGNETFELTLRQNARFSDGTPVNAAAVKTWLNYYLHANGPFATGIKVNSITTSGEWTVILHLGAPKPGLGVYFSDISTGIGLVGSPKAVADPSTLADGTDGAGPYVVVQSQSVSENQYVLVPNKYYFDPAAIKFSKIVVKVISNPTTMLEAIDSGQLDAAVGDVSTLQAAHAAGLHITAEPAGFAGMLFLDRASMLPNGSSPNPLADVKVRQALNYAIDREAIAKGILGQYATPSSEPLNSDEFDPSYENYYPYDPGKARALLAAAGYSHGFTLSILDDNFAGSFGDPVTEAIGKYLTAIGVTLNITAAPTETSWVQGFLSGKYPAAGFFQDPLGSTYENYGVFLAPKGIGNQHGWDDPTLDSLAQKGAASASPAEYWKAIMDRSVQQADELTALIFDGFWYSKSINGIAFSAAAGVPLPTEWSPTT